MSLQTPSFPVQLAMTHKNRWDTAAAVPEMWHSAMKGMRCIMIDHSSHRHYWSERASHPYQERLPDVWAVSLSVSPSALWSCPKILLCNNKNHITLIMHLRLICTQGNSWLRWSAETFPTMFLKVSKTIFASFVT